MREIIFFCLGVIVGIVPMTLRYLDERRARLYLASMLHHISVVGWHSGLPWPMPVPPSAARKGD